MRAAGSCGEHSLSRCGYHGPTCTHFHAFRMYSVRSLDRLNPWKFRESKREGVNLFTRRGVLIKRRGGSIYSVTQDF